MLESYEEFSDEEKKILRHFVTNTDSSIFALLNLPEVIKGALFSRYSRSSLGLRSLLLKEFIQNGDDPSFQSIVGNAAESGSDLQIAAIKKAQNFYDRILDGYGDDSIGELGGAHLAIENISMLAAKAIEDLRVGGSPLEKSTRYIYFSQKVKGDYLFYREPVLMTSAYRDLYLSTCNSLFDTYVKLIEPLTTYIEAQYPREPDVSKAAYSASVRAKVLDLLRGLLPAGALTNVGVFGNGRFFEYMIQRLTCHDLTELQEMGKKSFEELSKVIPSFIRRGDPNHKHFQSFAQFHESMANELRLISSHHTAKVESYKEPGVRLVSSDKEAVYKVAAALLFSMCDKGLKDLLDYVKKLPEEEINRILDAAVNARETRRHKSPRALEHAHFTFEFLADFAAFRDIHRHRVLTQERQQLSCDYGYYMPDSLVAAGLDAEYKKAMEQAKAAFETMRAELPVEAQYVVPMAYRIRWYFDVNLRSLQWMCELRSSPSGHPSYRFLAQQMAKEVSKNFPQFERFFKFVDFGGYELGRLRQEQRSAKKRGLE